MGPTFRSSALKFTLVSLTLLVPLPAAQAQIRLGGSQPTVLLPRPSAPLQSGDIRRSPAKGLPNKPVLNMTLVDPGPIGAETTTNIYFAQVAIGGGYSTIFTLMNTGSTTTTGTLFLTGQDGSPLTVNLAAATDSSALTSSGSRFDAVGSNFPISVPSGGTKLFTATAVSASDPTRSGWARAENIGGTLGGVGTFQLTEGGVLKTIAGVLASQPVQFATIPVDNDDSQSRFTGFAVANHNSDRNIRVRLVTVNDNGTVVDNIQPSALNPLGPLRQIARFLHEQGFLPARTKFKGSMVLVGEAGSSFIVVALVLNQGLLTAIPVIPEKAPNVPN